MELKTVKVGLLTVGVVAVGAIVYALGVGLPMAAVADVHADDIDPTTDESAS